MNNIRCWAFLFVPYSSFCCVLRPLQNSLLSTTFQNSCLRTAPLDCDRWHPSAFFCLLSLIFPSFLSSFIIILLFFLPSFLSFFFILTYSLILSLFFLNLFNFFASLLSQVLDKGEKRKIGVFKKNEDVVSKPYLQRPRKLETVRNRLWTDKREGVPRHGQKMGSPVGAVLYSDGWGAILIELYWTLYSVCTTSVHHIPLSHPSSHQIKKAYRSNQSSSLVSSIISNIPSSPPSIPPSLYSSRKPIHHYLPQFITTPSPPSLPSSPHTYPWHVALHHHIPFESKCYYRQCSVVLGALTLRLKLFWVLVLHLHPSLSFFLPPLCLSSSCSLSRC